MIHPNTRLQFISDEIGLGVVATQLIPKGTITWVFDKLDRRFTPRELAQLGQEYAPIIERYGYRDNAGDYILCWDSARYVNHSFRSNCLSSPYGYEVAVRDILPGEQLTDDYGYLNVSEPFVPIDEGEERKVVYPDDLVRFHSEWDASLLAVFPLLHKLDQPLQRYMSEDSWLQALRVSRGEEKLESILRLYFDPSSAIEIERGIP